MHLRVINEAEIRSVLDMQDAIGLMKSAFLALHNGDVISPVRTMITNRTGTVLYKPAYWDDAQIFCQKIVSVFPGNAKTGLPVTTGVIQVNDAQNGLPIAILDAGYITGLRTGAATGLATDLMARNSVRVGALFGTGGQAAFQLEAMLAVRPFEKMHVFSRSEKNAQRFCQTLQPRFESCELVPQQDTKVLRQCEVITTITTSEQALFPKEELAQDVHINAIGSLGPNRTEIADDIVAAAWIAVDQREACIPEAGEFRKLLAGLDIDEVFEPIEVGEILSGKAAPPKSGISIFKSVGNAVQDIVCVRHVLSKLDSKPESMDQSKPSSSPAQVVAAGKVQDFAAPQSPVFVKLNDA